MQSPERGRWHHIGLLYSIGSKEKIFMQSFERERGHHIGLVHPIGSKDDIHAIFLKGKVTTH